VNKFEHYLDLLGMIEDSCATRSALERCKRGFFADKLDFYVEQGILFVEKSSDPRDDKFFLTSIGKKLWRHEMRIEDVIGGHQK